MHLIGIVLLFLLDLSGFQDILGKKRAWLLLSVRKFVLHALIHTRLDFNVARYFVVVKTRTPDEDEILSLGGGESNRSDNWIRVSWSSQTK